MAPITLADIAKRVSANVCGDNSLTVDHVASLTDAGDGALTFLANPKYRPQLATTRATAAIVGSEIAEAPCALLQVENPDLAFAQAVELLVPPPPAPAVGTHPSAVVAEDAVLGQGVAVGACAVVESGARIGARTLIYPGAYVGCGVATGEDCILYPGAVLYHGVCLGNSVIVHANAVIGSDGFGYAWNGVDHVKIAQVGTVEVGDHVEIGACTTIDRARFGKTVIGPGTKLDNLIQIAHNVRLGAKCAFAAQVGISGSTTIGHGVLMGGQSGAAGHLDIGDGALVTSRSGITKSLPGNAQYTGFPARPHKGQLDEWRNIKALPRLRARLRELEARVAELEQDGEEETS